MAAKRAYRSEGEQHQADENVSAVEPREAEEHRCKCAVAHVEADVRVLDELGQEKRGAHQDRQHEPRLQAAAIEKRKITVQRELEPDLPRILIEKNRLMQVILNLIKNSCEALDGQDDPQRPNEIRVRSHAENGKTHLEISDNGVGIAPENISKIGTFGLSTKGSSGFGLFYCKMFVEAHHGTLLIRSEGIGKGASIVMCFPVAPGNI